MTTVFIISAPSGSGKSTLVHRLLKTVPNLAFSISYTTRPPRPSETHGVDYIFISRKDFEERLARGEFLEYAEVFGNYYGTNRETFESATRQGKDLVLDIDVQGARQLKSSDSAGDQHFCACRRRGTFWSSGFARGRRTAKK